jgi:hypothetical protein
MPASVAREFFDGKAFADWRKNREQELKLQAAIVDRLNGVIRACGHVAKAVASLGRLR